MEQSTAQVSVAVANDFDVVVRGVADLLDGDPRIRVVDASTDWDEISGVDVVLVDTFGVGAVHSGLGQLLEDPRIRAVVVYTWSQSPERTTEYLNRGVHGVLGKSLGAQDLRDAVVRVARGEVLVVQPSPAPYSRTPYQEQEVPHQLDWPGREDGLSARESEIIAMVTSGSTNVAIADACFLSINSVKSYIRSAYRKMGVERRSQAVLWGVRHGFLAPPAGDGSSRD